MQNLEPLIAQLISVLAEPASETPPPRETTFRERMFELVVVAFGNLYPNMPATGQIYDRITIARVTLGLEDGDAAMMGKRTDDWLRLEGLIKQEEGKRAYFLPLPATAFLSTMTTAGTLGDICAKVVTRYTAANPSDGLRIAVRNLGAEILMIMNR